MTPVRNARIEPLGDGFELPGDGFGAGRAPPMRLHADSAKS